jgi:hypothetical protein
MLYSKTTNVEVTMYIFRIVMDWVYYSYLEDNISHVSSLIPDGKRLMHILNDFIKIFQ